MRGIERTKWAMLLLVFGSLLFWIPLLFLGLVGYVLIVLGSLLGLFGLKPFGRAHRRNVILAVVVFIVGGVALVGGSILVVILTVSGTGPGTTEAQLAAVLAQAITNVLVVAAVSTMAYLLGAVLYTYALQARAGRMLLWAGYGASLGVQFAVLAIVLPLVPALAAEVAHQIVITGQVDSATIASAFSGPAAGVDYLNAVPAMLFAAANYLAWSRINKGEVPVPPSLPAPAAAPAAVGSPPAPPMNPP